MIALLLLQFLAGNAADTTAHEFSTQVSVGLEFMPSENVDISTWIGGKVGVGLDWDHLWAQTSYAWLKSNRLTSSGYSINSVTPTGEPTPIDLSRTTQKVSVGARFTKWHFSFRAGLGIWWLQEQLPQIDDQGVSRVCTESSRADLSCSYAYLDWITFQQRSDWSAFLVFEPGLEWKYFGLHVRNEFGTPRTYALDLSLRFPL